MWPQCDHTHTPTFHSTLVPIGQGKKINKDIR